MPGHPAAEWERELEAYAAAHPETRVFDLPAATYPLRNRGTMVSFLDGEGWVFEVGDQPSLLASLCCVGLWLMRAGLL